MALLNINNLRAHYDEIRALHGVDVEINRGEVTTLIGANGAGKTTLLSSILQLVDTTGDIFFDDKRISNLKTSAIARLGIGYVIEGRGTFETLTVEENLQVGAYTRKDGKKNIDRDIQMMYQWFEKLKTYRKKPAGLLSGGEQQMLAIARALMLKPKLLLLDEPSMGLAPKIVTDIFDILQKIKQEQQLTILLAEQDVSLALDLSDTILLVETGRIIESGSSEMMREHPKVREAYIGY